MDDPWLVVQVLVGKLGIFSTDDASGGEASRRRCFHGLPISISDVLLSLLGGVHGCGHLALANEPETICPCCSTCWVDTRAAATTTDNDALASKTLT